jgi:hypothetical protein
MKLTRNAPLVLISSASTSALPPACFAACKT